MARGRPEGEGDSGGTEDVGIGRHVGPLPPVTAPMVPGWEDVEHDTIGEGGDVPDGLNPGDR